MLESQRAFASSEELQESKLLEKVINAIGRSELQKEKVQLLLDEKIDSAVCG
jgi:hypothetical protein